MALNPDDLIIFKEREEEREKKGKKPQQKPESQQEPQPELVIPEEMESTPEPIAELTAEQVQNPVEEVIATPEKIEQPQVETSMIAQPGEELDYSKILGKGTIAETRVDVTKIKNKKLRASESRKLAAKMNCSMHPWRKGYAICDYCKKPYCYEDIMEYNGFYYCLDDIDRVSQAIRQTLELKYTKLSILSSILFLMILVIFIYYQNTAVISLVSTLASSGISALYPLNIPNITSLADILLVALTFVSGVLVMITARLSFKVSAITGLGTVALFSYQYLNSGTVAFGAVAMMSFIGLVTLAYSRVSEEVLPEESILTSDVVSPTEFANTKGF